MRFHRPSSVIGLSLEPDQAVVVCLRRVGKQVQMVKHLQAPVPAAEFRDDPAAAGQELRRCLQAARIRSERCVVCVPLSWALTAQLDLSELSDGELHDYIQSEAENRFPIPPEDLLLSIVASPSNRGAHRALLVGVPLEHLNGVRAALKAAKLRPASITFGTAVLADEHMGAPCALVHLGKGFADLAIMGQGEIAALRNLVWHEGASNGDARMDAKEVARQFRITLAQFPPDSRALLKKVVVYGQEEWPEDVRDVLSDSFSSQGVSLVAGGIGDRVASSVPVSPALLMSAARDLLKATPPVELSPKRKARFQRAASRLSARGARWGLGLTAAILAIVLGSFFFQDRKLASLEATWAELGPKVEAVRSLQGRVRKYRSWYEASYASLAIPKSLTAVFPEEGTVWLKTMQIKTQNLVTCSGSARSRKDWMEVYEKLGKQPEFDQLQVVQARGDSPFLFTFTFRWKGGGSGGQ